MVAVLGVDPSLVMTGLACSDGLHLYVRRVGTQPSPPTVGGKLYRLRYIVEQVLAFAPSECMTVIEAPVVAHGGAGGGLFDRSGLYWMLIDRLWERGPVVSVQPATRAIYAAGNGNASKEEVLESMRSRPPGISIKDDNIADALALAAMGARWLDRPFDGDLPFKVLRAMSTPNWPSGIRDPRPYLLPEEEASGDY